MQIIIKIKAYGTLSRILAFNNLLEKCREEGFADVIDTITVEKTL